jgi:hypothetical protein
MEPEYGWQQMLTHNGRFVVEVSLSTRDAVGSGKVRPIQSGMRPNWLHEATGRILEGPIILLGGIRSLRPGEVGQLAIHPFRPQEWAGISEDSELGLLSARQTVVGSARVISVVDMPDRAEIDLSWMEPPSPPGSNWLTR